MSLFKLKKFLYSIKNPQVEAGDPYLPHSLRRDDYHDAGYEDDSVSVVGGLLVTVILDNDHWMDLLEQFCGRRPPEDEDAKRAK